MRRKSLRRRHETKTVSGKETVGHVRDCSHLPRSILTSRCAYKKKEIFLVEISIKVFLV